MAQALEVKSFAQRDVAVTLTGAQWFCLLLGLSGNPISPDGERVLETAIEELERQLLAAKKEPLT